MRNIYTNHKRNELKIEDTEKEDDDDKNKR